MTRNDSDSLAKPIDTPRESDPLARNPPTDTTLSSKKGGLDSFEDYSEYLCLLAECADHCSERLRDAIDQYKGESNPETYKRIAGAKDELRALALKTQAVELGFQG